MKRTFVFFLLIITLLVTNCVEASIKEENRRLLLNKSLIYIQEFYKNDFSAIKDAEKSVQETFIKEWNELIKASGTYKSIFNSNIYEKDNYIAIGIIAEHSKKYIGIIFYYTKDGILSNISSELVAIYDQEELIKNTLKHRNNFKEKIFSEIYNALYEEKKKIVTIEFLEELHSKFTARVGNMEHGIDIKCDSIGGNAFVSILDKYEATYLITLFIYNQQGEILSMKFYFFDSEEKANAFRQSGYK